MPSGPSGVDQVSVSIFDPVNNAIRVYVGSGGVASTPHDADQVFTGIFNSAYNAIQVECVPSGCGGSSAFSSLTSGTNTTATMTLGNGATFNSAAGSTFNFAATAPTAFYIPVAAGAAPTANGQIGLNSTTNGLVWGSNGNTVSPVQNPANPTVAGTTYHVGPGNQYATLAALAAALPTSSIATVYDDACENFSASNDPFQYKVYVHLYLNRGCINTSTIQLFEGSTWRIESNGREPGSNNPALAACGTVATTIIPSPSGSCASTNFPQEIPDPQTAPTLAATSVSSASGGEVTITVSGGNITSIAVTSGHLGSGYVTANNVPTSTNTATCTTYPTLDIVTSSGAISSVVVSPSAAYSGCSSGILNVGQASWAGSPASVIGTVDYAQGDPNNASSCGTNSGLATGSYIPTNGCLFSVNSVSPEATAVSVSSTTCVTVTPASFPGTGNYAYTYTAPWIAWLGPSTKPGGESATGQIQAGGTTSATFCGFDSVGGTSNGEPHTNGTGALIVEGNNPFGLQLGQFGAGVQGPISLSCNGYASVAVYVQQGEELTANDQIEETACSGQAPYIAEGFSSVLAPGALTSGSGANNASGFTNMIIDDGKAVQLCGGTTYPLSGSLPCNPGVGVTKANEVYTIAACFIVDAVPGFKKIEGGTCAPDSAAAVYQLGNTSNLLIFYPELVVGNGSPINALAIKYVHNEGPGAGAGSPLTDYSAESVYCLSVPCEVSGLGSNSSVSGVSAVVRFGANPGFNNMPSYSAMGGSSAYMLFPVGTQCPLLDDFQAGYPPDSNCPSTGVGFTAGKALGFYSSGQVAGGWSSPDLPNPTAPAIFVNNSATGTTLNTLTLLTGAPSTAQIAATSTVNGVVGITTTATATSGIAAIQTSGLVNCVFSNGTTAGDYVLISNSQNSASPTAGDCYDSGSASYPVGGAQVIGRVLSTNGSAGTYQIDLFPSEHQAYVGELTESSSYTGGTSADFGKLIVMNCSSACTYTMNGSPPVGYYGSVISIGGTTATVSLNSLNYNGSSSVPALVKYQPISFSWDGSGYEGNPGVAAGTDLSVAGASNNIQVAFTNAPSLFLSSAYTNATTSFTSVFGSGMASIAASKTVRGMCSITWEGSSTSITPSFGMGLSSSTGSPDLYVTATYNNGAFVAPTWTTISSTTVTAVTGAMATTAASTPYHVQLNFTLVNGTAANTVTLYGESSSSSYTLTAEPETSCGWLP